MRHSRMSVGGLKVGYRAEETPYQQFKEVLERAGYGKHVPNPRTDHSALVAAVGNKLGGRNRLVTGKGGRGKKKSAGVELVEVARHEYCFNDYSPKMRAKVAGSNGSTKVLVEDSVDDQTLGSELTDEFLRTKAVLTTSAINGAINAIMAKEMFGQPSLTGTYIPEAFVPAWKDLAEQLFGKWDADGNLISEGICRGIYEPASVELDEDTIRSIRERLRTEVNEEAEAIELEVSKGTLNADQIKTRCNRAQVLLERIGVYDVELRETQNDLRKVADRANRMAMAAYSLEVLSSL